MAKELSEDLASYLLGLARGQWSRSYNQRCLAMWRETYGEKIAQRVESLVKSGWKSSMNARQ